MPGLPAVAPPVGDRTTFEWMLDGTFLDDGRAIRGTWEICFDGETWQKDFDLNYTRAD